MEFLWVEFHGWYDLYVNSTGVAVDLTWRAIAVAVAIGAGTVAAVRIIRKRLSAR